MFDQFFPFDPLPLDELLEEIPQRFRRYVGPGPISPGAWREVAQALATLRPEASAALARLQRNSDVRWRSSDARLIAMQEGDAVSLAVRLSAMERPSDYAWNASSEAAPFLHGLSFADIGEDVVLNNDLNVFGDWSRMRQFVVGAVEFARNGHRLTIVNVNRQPLESTLGVDLIYYSHAFQAFLLVQYKMLDREGSARFVYRPDSSFESQLTKMRSIPEDVWDRSHSAYRLGPGAAFLKFCYREIEIW